MTVTPRSIIVREKKGDIKQKEGKLPTFEDLNNIKCKVIPASHHERSRNSKPDIGKIHEIIKKFKCLSCQTLPGINAG
uniref:Uncharacterized protein n=1 Tax=Megaselia scalaris TaxID=36166 RepID=T1GF69_MEGSC